MGTKVKTAVYGKDLRVELKDFELTKAGNKIDITKGGKGYFKPEIGPTNFLDFPSWKRFILFGKRSYTRVYFALKKGSRCIDFLPEEGTIQDAIIYGPDEEQLKEAELNLLATRIGQDNEPKTPWVLYLIIMLQLVIIGILANMAGMFR
jgi:hypothetical protein